MTCESAVASQGEKHGGLHSLITRVYAEMKHRVSIQQTSESSRVDVELSARGWIQLCLCVPCFDTLVQSRLQFDSCSINFEKVRV
jgi:hypothetical protein